MIIETQNLSKTYKNGFKAVNQLNLHIEEGDIYGFLGPNGAGKTTTIRMLTGLIEPTEGVAYVNQENVSEKNSTIKKLIGVLPESHGYYSWMTGYEYLEYFYNLFGGDPLKAKDQINYLLDKVQLLERSNSRIGQYSRGMKQRLGLAKTLINNPKIIFLDEPTLGLDPSGQNDIHKLILELNKSMNITVFITSHLLKDIEVLCNKVAIIKDGNLLVEDTIVNLQKLHSPQEIYRIKTSDTALAITFLKSISGIAKMETEVDYVEVTLKNVQETDLIKRRIVETLFMNHIDVFEITKVKSSMEDIFLNLVNSSTTSEVKS